MDKRVNRDRTQKLERYVDAVSQYRFVKPNHFRLLFGAIPDRTSRHDLASLVSGGSLRRLRSSKDEPYTYMPRAVRERSVLTLAHDTEITSIQILLNLGARDCGLKLLVSERRRSRIQLRNLAGNATGVCPVLSTVPDFFAVIGRAAGSSDDVSMRCIFWEVTNAKSGHHWDGENDIVGKCHMYNRYFESGLFSKWLQKEFQISAANFRVIISFPTEQRARNFVNLLRQKDVPYLGRFWATWHEAYHTEMYGPIFVSPKADGLHSLRE